MILNADDRPYCDNAAGASDEAGRSVDHGRGYTAARFHGQAKTLKPKHKGRRLGGLCATPHSTLGPRDRRPTARHNHSRMCAMTSPNSKSAADQTSAETKL